MNVFFVFLEFISIIFLSVFIMQFVVFIVCHICISKTKNSSGYISMKLLLVALKISRQCTLQRYDTKLNLMVRLHFWTSGECRVLLHYHYF